MGCMMDHPLHDVKQKLADVRQLLAQGLVDRLAQSLETVNWEQPSLNELFHALRKLEKSMSTEEQKLAAEVIQSILTNQS